LNDETACWQCRAAADPDRAYVEKLNILSNRHVDGEGYAADILRSLKACTGPPYLKSLNTLIVVAEKQARKLSCQFAEKKGTATLR
jgi:hypothetical protein